MQSMIDKIPNQSVCEAMNCNATATIGIEVRVDRGRNIFLHLCDGCVPTFKEKLQYSEPLVSSPDQSLANHRRAKELQLYDTI
jgi:hypothetical protein